MAAQTAPAGEDHRHRGDMGEDQKNQQGSKVFAEHAGLLVFRKLASACSAKMRIG